MSPIPSMQELLASARTLMRATRSSSCWTRRLSIPTCAIIATVLMVAAPETRAAGDDDSSSVATALPNNGNSQQVILFTLKKNDLSIRVQPDDFCRDLGYGEAAKPQKKSDVQDGYWDIDEYGSDGKKPGNLNWVICRFPPNAK
jgi:hypothetical protein